MRELRVVGVEADGTHVICQDPESGEKYRIPSDERLRAAARGDISRLGQIEIEMESALRPREIQARIRAGATVAEVAAIAGVTVDKIERFAHPVLLERTRAAELAAYAHPIRHDGPAVATLDESTSEALVAYGQNPQDAVWDAWKGDDGCWVVQIAWQVGRSDNVAHWRFQPGSHGGTVDPLDDLADELSHPEWIQPRRRLTPVATPELTPTVDVTPDGVEEVTVDANSIIGAQRARHERKLPDSDAHGTVPIDFDALVDPEPPVAAPKSAAAPAVASETSTAEIPAESDDPATSAGPDTNDSDATDANALAEPAVTALPEPDESAKLESADSETTDPAHTDPESAGDESAGSPNDSDDTIERRPRRRKSRKPAVPAWEDVLLGVRSNGSS